MSNVSDTNEIVAVRLLFPLARTFLMGCMSIRFLDFHQPHDHPELGATGQLQVAARVHLRAKASAWSEHLYQRPKCVVRPRNVPKRCTSAITAKMEPMPGWPVDL
jgi:hypothetical protein